MASANLGRVSIVAEGDYTSTQSYARLSLVTYEGYPYLAKVDVPAGNLPTDELYWMPMLTDLDFAPGGYGLGGDSVSQELDNITKNGFYYANVKGYVCTVLHENINAKHATQVAITTTSGSVKCYVRSKTNGVWTDWVDWSPSAFAPSGYGLGEYCKLISMEALDGVTNNGWYQASGSITIDNTIMWHPRMLVIAGDAVNLTQELYPISVNEKISNTKLRRRCHDGVWKPWEWENPPMALGVEYRTTERRNGQPVYTKLINFGKAVNGSSTFAHNLGGVRIIRHNGTIGNTEGGVWALPYFVGDNIKAPYTYWCNANYLNVLLFVGAEADVSGYDFCCQLWYVKV